MFVRSASIISSIPSCRIAIYGSIPSYSMTTQLARSRRWFMLRTCLAMDRGWTAITWAREMGVFFSLTVTYYMSLMRYRFDSTRLPMSEMIVSVLFRLRNLRWVHPQLEVLTRKYCILIMATVVPRAVSCHSPSLGLRSIWKSPHGSPRVYRKTTCLQDYEPKSNAPQDWRRRRQQEF